MARVSGQSDEATALVMLGRAVRAARKANGLSQEALADVAGIDRSHMGKIERGERNVTFLNIVRISRALKMPAAKLILDAGL